MIGWTWRRGCALRRWLRPSQDGTLVLEVKDVIEAVNEVVGWGRDIKERLIVRLQATVGGLLVTVWDAGSDIISIRVMLLMCRRCGGRRWPGGTS